MCHLQVLTRESGNQHRGPKTRMSESSFLPIELYGNILQYVPTHDLAIACLASATLQREAETILYRAITLDCRSSHARILCWCAAINGSSRRAETVHTLSVPALIAIHVQDTKSGDILEASLSSALNKLVNLKQLTLKQNRFRAGPDQVHLPSINPSSIGLFPFRLQDLSGDFIAFTSDDLWRFLSTQPDIRSWAIGSPAVECLHQLSRSILPKLSGVHLPNCKELKFLAPRPIERLSVHLFVIGDGERDNVLIRSLDLFKNTLQHLTCYVEGSGELEDWKAADFIRSVAKQVPLLKSLTYYKNSDPTARVSITSNRGSGSADQLLLCRALTSQKFWMLCHNSAALRPSTLTWYCLAQEITGTIATRSPNNLFPLPHPSVAFLSGTMHISFRVYAIPEVKMMGSSSQFGIPSVRQVHREGNRSLARKDFEKVGLEEEANTCDGEAVLDLCSY
jgi:hypothetical protein